MEKKAKIEFERFHWRSTKIVKKISTNKYGC